MPRPTVVVFFRGSRLTEMPGSWALSPREIAAGGRPAHNISAANYTAKGLQGQVGARCSSDWHHACGAQARTVGYHRLRVMICLGARATLASRSRTLSTIPNGWLSRSTI